MHQPFAPYFDIARGLPYPATGSQNVQHDSIPGPRAFNAVLHHREAGSSLTVPGRRFSVYRRVGSQGPDHIRLEITASHSPRLNLSPVASPQIPAPAFFPIAPDASAACMPTLAGSGIELKFQYLHGGTRVIELPREPGEASDGKDAPDASPPAAPTDQPIDKQELKTR